MTTTARQRRRKRQYIRVFVGDSLTLTTYMTENRPHFDDAELLIYRRRRESNDDIDNVPRDVTVIRCGSRVKELAYVDDNVMLPPRRFKEALTRIPSATQEKLVSIARQQGVTPESLNQCRNYGQLVRELVRTVQPRFRTFGDDFEVDYANEWG